MIQQLENVRKEIKGLEQKYSELTQKEWNICAELSDERLMTKIQTFKRDYEGKYFKQHITEDITLI